MKIKSGKNGVAMDILTTQILIAVVVCNDVFNRFNVEMIISSITDGKHMKGSLHYEGKAFDVSIWNIPIELRNQIVSSIKTRLGQLFDVVLEKDHIHIEYDPD